jgi:bidirectional [NiFe] hydrogenase diaphorase subunit
VTTVERPGNTAAPTAPPFDKRQRLLEATLKRHQFRQDSLIEALHTAQNAYGFLTPELLWYVARQLRLPPSRVYGVATFYNFFSLKPPGEHVLVLCQGTACYIKGAPACAAAVRAAHGVASGQTTGDGRLSVLTARCLGSCGMAPTAVLDRAFLGNLTPDALLEALAARLGASAAAAP